MKLAHAAIVAIVATACGASAPSPTRHALPIVDPTPRGAAVDPTKVIWSKSITECAPRDVTLLLPFLEGVVVEHAGVSLASTGYDTQALAYPGAMSLPLVGYRCAGDWTIAYVDSLEIAPVTVTAHANASAVSVSLQCAERCEFRTQRGARWEDVARNIGAELRPRTPPPLATNVHAFHFYVHDWVATEGDALRTDWPIDALSHALDAEPAGTAIHVFGLDPNSIDLEGRYLWADGAEKNARALIASHPLLAFHSWLNLRTYKTRIPAMKIERAPPADVRAAMKVFDDGPHMLKLPLFEGWEMCLASAEWQASRMRELAHLVDVGYRIIAIDEFPAPASSWRGDVCLSTHHLHAAGDAKDEARVTREFLERIAAYAKTRGVTLTCEEPSGFMLPYVSGYMNGMFNEPPDYYEMWSKSDAITRVPLFSTMFGDVVTPYTRPDPRRDVPAPWLAQKKAAH